MQRRKVTIHVHQAKLRAGEPAIIVRTWRGSPKHYRKVEIQGPAVLEHLDQPDDCGARLVLTTYGQVIADGEVVP